LSGGGGCQTAADYILQHTHCNTHTATHTATHTLQHTHCNTHTSTHTLQHTALGLLHSKGKHTYLYCNIHCTTHCNTHCNTLQARVTELGGRGGLHDSRRLQLELQGHLSKVVLRLHELQALQHCNTLQHTTMHCNTLQHTATHCNALQDTAMHCNTLQCTATHCNTLQHTATHCNTLQHDLKAHSSEVVLCRHELQALQHAATHTATQ